MRSSQETVTQSVDESQESDAIVDVNQGGTQSVDKSPRSREPVRERVCVREFEY